MQPNSTLAPLATLNLYDGVVRRMTAHLLTTKKGRRELRAILDSFERSMVPTIDNVVSIHNRRPIREGGGVGLSPIEREATLEVLTSIKSAM